MIADLLRGQRVLVVGSAPDLVWPTDTDRLTFCVNGAAGLAKRAGRPIDVWSVTAEMCRGNTSYRQQTLRFVEGVHAAALVVAGDGPVERVTNILQARGCQVGEVSLVTLAERAAITASVLGVNLGVGRPDARISSGLFAICLALWSGASDVAAIGISLQPGHAYTRDGSTRTHGPADAKALRIVRDRVRTTSSALQQRYGMAAC